MVHVVLAGGAGQVGREILHVLLKQGKHQVTVFTRGDVSDLGDPTVKVIKVDYSDKADLVKHLRGVQVVLSFVNTAADPEGSIQKVLIDASIAAGVKRFAPSEWATRSDSGAPGYAGKDEVHKYLQQVNKEKKVLEYTLFQCGMFTNYLSFPYPSTEYMHIFGLQIDLEHRRAIVLEGVDIVRTFTTVQDVARVALEAIDYEDEWPKIGGINGSTIAESDLLKLIESIRGPLEIEKVSKDDILAGKLNTSWAPDISHPSIPPEQRGEQLSRMLSASFFATSLKGAWLVSDEWNKLLPQLQLTTIDKFLHKYWDGKP